MSNMKRPPLEPTVSFGDLKCEFCNGKGEREINIDGADCPTICSFCRGTGIDETHLDFILEASITQSESGLTPKQLWEELKRIKEESERLLQVKRELLEQRNELLEALKISKQYMTAWSAKGYDPLVGEKLEQHLDQIDGVIERINGPYGMY